MNHPSEAVLALYAGSELGLWARLRVARHVRVCDECSRHVEEYRALRDWTLGQAGELPPGLNWNALALEMKANIRVGLAAGQCVADCPPSPARFRAPALVLPALLVIIAALILQTVPPPVTPRALLGSRDRQAAVGSSDLVLEAGSNGIGFQAGGRGFALIQPRAHNIVFSVRGQGALRARYVDSDTGQVTISHVYAQ